MSNGKFALMELGMHVELFVGGSNPLNSSKEKLNFEFWPCWPPIYPCYIQFDSIAFRTFYSKLKIKNLYATPCYPQSNGQTEVTNKTLLCTKENAAIDQRKVGRRVAWSPVGISDNTRAAYMNHFFCPCLSNESCYSNWDRHVHRQNNRTRSKGWKSWAWKAPGLGRSGKRKRGHPDSLLSTKSYCPLQ